MRSVVIGNGSIGQRHWRLLDEMGTSPLLVSRRPSSGRRSFTSVAEAILDCEPGLVVVATETSNHFLDLESLAATGYRGRVLVEKPLFAVRHQDVPANEFSDLRIAYNLRLHPLIDAFCAALGGEKPKIIQAAAGQYLPDWRPGRDWTSSYSAESAKGGGVLRDLSHELDLLLWLCGPVADVFAIGGRSGLLPINSDDHWSILLAFVSGSQASLQLDYLNRPGRRFLAAEFAGGSLRADFTTGTLTLNGEVQHVETTRDESYRRQLEAMLTGDTDRLCDVGGATMVLDVIDRIERCAAERLSRP